MHPNTFGVALSDPNTQIQGSTIILSQLWGNSFRFKHIDTEPPIIMHPNTFGVALLDPNTQIQGSTIIYPNFGAIHLGSNT